MQFLQVFNKLVNAVIPHQCAICSDIVETARSVCPPCWGGLNFIDNPLCSVCGHPFDYHTPTTYHTQATCAGCLTDPPVFTALRGSLVYDEASKPLLMKFKHGDQTHLAHTVCPFMLRSLKSLQEAAEVEFDLIMPVPLHWTRLLKRRYNQAALLAQVLANATQVPIRNRVLRRHKKTASQGHLDSRSRLDNLKDAFEIKHPDQVRGKSIVLVDDVYTTGATVNACAKSLLKAGAKQVSVLTLARVIHPH